MLGSGSIPVDVFNDLRHVTEGCWNDWDPNSPPTEFMELAGPKQNFERPDQWIRPDKYFPDFDLFVQYAQINCLASKGSLSRRIRFLPSHLKTLRARSV